MAFKGMRDVDTVGEMVETEASARFLCDVGVQYGQGYLFGRPIRDITGWRPAERGRAAAAQ
jgi:EAL domain-containing protein (putative c-di-GMP-specific phosphodiesterase class I)